jgi:alcohol dehydrogenase (cytochrome c)
LLSTAGGLVFAGTSDGFFKVLDAKSGEELWRINLGAAILASPMTYDSGGRQKVAVAAGGGVFVFALPRLPAN